MPAKPAAKNKSALALYDERMAELARQSAEAEAGVGGGGNFLSIRSGVLSYKGEEIEDNQLNVVILDALFEHAWYDEPFDPDNPVSPACYAFGRVLKDLAPHENVVEPQSDRCGSCQYNAFGSADRGKGKACPDRRRIAFVTEGDLDDLDVAEIGLLKLPYYSHVEYSNYVKELKAKANRSPIAFVTEISVVPDKTSQFRVKFQTVRAIEDGEQMGKLLEMIEAAGQALETPYPNSAEQEEEEEAPPPKKTASKSNGKTAPKPVAVKKPAVPLPPSSAAGLRRPAGKDKF